MSTLFSPYSQRGDESNHESLRSQLPAYAILCLQGELDPGAWQELTRHLAGCPSCREELDDLTLMLEETANGPDQLEELPAFDLTTLPPFAARQPDERAPTRPETPSASHGVQLDLGNLLLTALQRPQYTDGMGQNGAAMPRLPAYHHQISVGPPDSLVIALELALSDAEPSLYQLTVTVVQDSSHFGQGRHQMTLALSDRRLEAITDGRGSVIFGGLPREALGDLRLNVQLDNAS